MADRKQTVTILGCGGFIGSYLLEKLLKTTGYHCIGLDCSSRKISNLLGHKRLTFHSTDIHSTAALRPLLEKSGTVISLAALCNPYLYNHTPIRVIESNFVKMYPLVQACTELECRLIHFSTSEVYGRTLAGALGSIPHAPDDPECHLLNETASALLLGPVHVQRWSYASAKQLLERTIHAYGFERGLDYTIVRPFNFIGPRMDFIPGIDGEGVPRVIACFMDALLHGKVLQLVDGGKNRRCFTAIDDAVGATLRILDRPEAARRKIFNIGNPANETTIALLAERMRQLYAEYCGRPVETVAPVGNVAAVEFYGDGYEDSDRRVPDITAAKTCLDWQPKIGLDEALRVTVKGFVEEYGGEKDEG